MAWTDYDVYGDPEEDRRVREELLRRQAVGQPTQPDYYALFAQHINEMPERPTKSPSLLRKIAGTILYGPGQGGPQKQSFMRPEYAEQMQQWGAKGKQLEALTGLAADQAKEKRSAAEHLAGMETEKSKQGYYKAAEARVSAPEVPRPPTTFESYMAQVAAGTIASDNATPEEAHEFIVDRLSNPTTKSTYEQKFDQRVRELMLGGAANTEADAKRLAAEEMIKERKLEGEAQEAGLESTKTLTAQRRSMIEYREKLAAGKMKAADARAMIGLIRSEAQTMVSNPLDPNYAHPLGDVMRRAAISHGADLDDLYQIALGEKGKEGPAGKEMETVSDAGPLLEKQGITGVSPAGQAPRLPIEPVSEEEPERRAAKAPKAPKAPKVKAQVTSAEEIRKYAAQEGIPYEAAKSIAEAEGWEVRE